MPTLVKRLVGGRARLVAVVLALVVMATASSCGGRGGTSGGGHKAAQPVITPKQAASVAMKLQRDRVTALTTENSTALPAIEADPQLTFDRDGIQQVKDQGNSLTASRFLSVVALVPKQTSYPAWFMAIGQVSSGKPALDLFTRGAATSPWQLAMQTGIYSGSIEWKEARGGWAVPANLNVDPSRTLSDYWNAATSGTSTASSDVAPGSMTSDIASQIKSKVAVAKSGGWTQAAGFAAGGSLPEAVQLTDGSSLSFAWVIEKLQTRDAYGACFPQPASNGAKWDPLVPDGHYLEVDVTYTYMEGMTTPSQGDLHAVSYADGTTGVQVTGCSS